MLHAFVELSKGSKKDVIVFTLRHRIPNTSEKLFFWWREKTLFVLCFSSTMSYCCLSGQRGLGEGGKTSVSD
jgi:hypothetical protein